MYDVFYHEEVEGCAAFLEYCQEVFQDKGMSLPPERELVIEVGASESSDDDLMWQYYFVDHATRTIFWLQRYILWKELEGMRGDLTPDHISTQRTIHSSTTI